MEKIAVFDYTTGQYSYHNIDNNIASILAKRIMEIHMNYTHNKPWSIVEFGENGSQIWKNTSRQVIPSPEEIEELVRKQIEAMVNP